MADTKLSENLITVEYAIDNVVILTSDEICRNVPGIFRS